MKKITSFYYITHIDNLSSILTTGLLSRQQMVTNAIKHQDIHDEQVLTRRIHKKLPNGNELAHYVNLYFQPRNAMLYRLTCNDLRKELVILQIDPSVLEIEGSYIADKNAAASDAHFFPSWEGIRQIDEKVFDQEYWTNNDDSKQKMMAEVLVPHQIAADKIIGVYVAQDNQTVKSLVGNKAYSIEPHLFFLPRFKQGLQDSNIVLVKGDMFFSSMQTFTISVNIVGVMGKGLASRAKYQFPDAYVRYQDDCYSKKLKIGKPTLYKRSAKIEEELSDEPLALKTENLNNSRWFLFLPTKKDWRNNSNLKDIELSMQWLMKNYKKQGIESIALPALGCGLGNLHWKEVGPMMCYYLQKMDIQSCIYLPMEKQLNEEYLSADYLLK